MTDPKVDPAALAERLEQLAEPKHRQGENKTGMTNAQVFRLAAAALRQRPQEERPYLARPLAMALREFVRAWDATQLKSTPRLEQAVSDADVALENYDKAQSQAPEERPDLIALEKLRDRLAVQMWTIDGEPAWELPDRILSALRAQAAEDAEDLAEAQRLEKNFASGVVTACAYPMPSRTETVATQVQPSPAERTALERTCATCRHVDPLHLPTCRKLVRNPTGSIRTFGCSLWAGPQARQEQE